MVLIVTARSAVLRPGSLGSFRVLMLNLLPLLLHSLLLFYLSLLLLYLLLSLL